MSSERVIRCAALVALWAALAAPAMALAQDEGRYRALVDEAVAEFNRGNFREAHALFRDAHELSPSARTHRGLGMALFELRRYAEALEELRAALADSRRPLGPEQRADVDRLLERAARFVARYRIVVDPPSARVAVDDQPFDASRELVLDIGDHRIAVSADGRVPETRRLRVDGGEQSELSFSLASSEPEQVATPSPQEELEDPEQLEDPAPGSAAAGAATPEPASAPRPAGDGGAGPLLGAGAALAAVALGAGIAWGYVADQRAACAAAEAEVDEGCLNASELEASELAAAAVTIGAGAVGVILAVVGGAMLASGGERGTQVACAPALAGVVCAGRF